ncbi:hypothetical protein SPHINGO391_460027 [Sphingomonas aurantiaca]|uniref:Uncharacterized protein n=1 Tax=Sphingomonas aurantiaca TaxID=185949 RepID=A0A5E7ZJA0_9SPHN|nr:hypothetical protein SPHINGO391_460027 [Sphingomonas aurantiaca]
MCRQTAHRHARFTAELGQQGAELPGRQRVAGKFVANGKLTAHRNAPLGHRGLSVRAAIGCIDQRGVAWVFAGPAVRPHGKDAGCSP